MCVERPLGLDRGRDGERRGREDDEEAVAVGSHLMPTVRGDSGADDGPMIAQHLAVALTEIPQQPSRALDVGEQHRDPPRQQRHSLSVSVEQGMDVAKTAPLAFTSEDRRATAFNAIQRP